MKVNYNERLAEILRKKDDRIYSQTAEIVSKSNINCLDYYLTHNERVPPIPGVNVHAFRYGIRKLLEESLEGKMENLTSLISA